MAERLRIKRVYEPPSPEDGQRILVDRLWPRGVSKQTAALTAWIKDVAPSVELRKWFDHDPQRWEDFRRRYAAELDANQSAIAELRGLLQAGPTTLVYAAHDASRNNAVVLSDYLGEPCPPAGEPASPWRSTGGT